MKDEITEILDKLKDSVTNPIDTEVDPFTDEVYDVPNYFCLDPTTNDCKVLLNHITSLKKKYDKALTDLVKESHRRMELEQENERLKEELLTKPDNEITLTTKDGQELTIIQSQRIDMQEKFNKSLEEMYKKYNNSKSRIDKVIPMLKKLNIKIKEILRIGIDIKEISDIENILAGGDENEC